MNSSRSQASTDFIPLLNNHDRLIWGFQKLDAWKTLVWLKFICNKQIKQTLSAGCQLHSPLLSAPLATLEQLRNPCINTNRKVHPFYNDGTDHRAESTYHQSGWSCVDRLKTQWNTGLVHQPVKRCIKYAVYSEIAFPAKIFCGIYLMLHCRHQNFCIKMGSNDSPFTVPLNVTGKVTRLSINHNFWQDRKAKARNQTN